MKNNPMLSRMIFVLRMIEVRMRFVVILIATGLVIGYWDLLANNLHRWQRELSGSPAETTQEASVADEGYEYFSPMHPFIVRDKPGKCPICGMDLVRRKKGGSADLPKGTLSRVQVSPMRMSEAGVATSKLAYRPLQREVRSFGTLAAPEDRLTRVVALFEGRVGEVFIPSAGGRVEKGQPLYTLISSGAFAALSEYQLAKREGGELAGASELRLQRMGLDPENLSASSPGAITFSAPVAGEVLEKSVLPGQQVDAGEPLFTIGDAGKLWLMVPIREADLAGVKTGLSADITLEGGSGTPISATLSWLAPSLDSAGHTLAGRLVLDNANGDLRPGQLAGVKLKVPVATEAAPDSKAPKGWALAVPETAVIDSGYRKGVYVKTGEGQFEGREVILGPRAGEYYPVQSGLAEGDEVATGGAFLIDAETRLNQGGR